MSSTAAHRPCREYCIHKCARDFRHDGETIPDIIKLPTSCRLILRGTDTALRLWSRDHVITRRLQIRRDKLTPVILVACEIICGINVFSLTPVVISCNREQNIVRYLIPLVCALVTQFKCVHISDYSTQSVTSMAILVLYWVKNYNQRMSCDRILR